MKGEFSRVFIDTNILVYAHDVSAESKHDLARKLIAALWETGQGCLSIQVLQEFYVTITKKVPLPLSAHEAERIIKDIAVWTCHTPDVEDVVVAIDMQQHYKISFWDAMIVRSAQRLGCSKIWSEDLNHGQVYRDVVAENPFYSDAITQ